MMYRHDYVLMIAWAVIVWNVVFDRVIVAIAYNPHKDSALFTPAERGPVKILILGAGGVVVPNCSRVQWLALS